MTREEARKILESGKSIKYHEWTFWDDQMSCPEGCCNDGFRDINDSLDTLFTFAAGEEDQIKEVNKP